MYRIPGVLSTATTKPAPAVPPIRPTPGLPPGSPQAPEDGRVTGPAQAIPGQAEDRERIALGLNDVVVPRLLTAAQDLQAALRLMGNHPATAKVRHAVDEMDQAVQDIRDTISDHPAGERPPLDTSTSTT
jgi:two-component system, NarL family, sensor histidine kinase DevS